MLHFQRQFNEWIKNDDQPFMVLRDAKLVKVERGLLPCELVDIDDLADRVDEELAERNSDSLRTR